MVVLALSLVACAEDVASEGDPEAITVLQREAGGGLTEWMARAEDYRDHVPEEDVVIRVALPEFTDAEPFTRALADRVEEEVQDFRSGTRGPVSLGVEWELVAAGGVLGVRLVRTEEDMHGLREAYATYWYDSTTGGFAYSTELLAGQEELDELNQIARQVLADDEEVSTESLHPVLRTYDSLGFNDDGDLVVEFDPGHLSPVVEGHVPSTEYGRKVVVVEHATAAPLLSDLGERARDASLVDEPDLTPSPAEGDDVHGGSPPGVFVPHVPDVDCYDGRTRCVALTFDDGPVEATDHLLDILAEAEVTASFFLNGDPVLTRPGTLRRAYAEGHEVASHGDLHDPMDQMTAQELPPQVAAVSAMIRRQTGHTVELFRPPFGATDEDVLTAIADQEMVETMWTVDSQDWRDLERDEIVENVVGRVEPGSVVLMHDPQAPTIAAVPEIIERLREMDYEFVTATQAIGHPDPGYSFPQDWDGDR
ncbi:polysaccharide deacetylase family protein [Nocardiopsis alkaliphila]|uniref:polysaccharide deacetylase family protein n=1 Tax=Nocardiopsis alkaliphila TaxID=225762 RepID=UPI00034858C0|nr:polysaccharide deacetylase family protein [Nocardiopsis alkaliphila]